MQHVSFSVLIKLQSITLVNIWHATPMCLRKCNRCLSNHSCSFIGYTMTNLIIRMWNADEIKASLLRSSVKHNEAHLSSSVSRDKSTNVYKNQWISHHAPNWLVWASFWKLHTLRKRNMCVKVSDTVLPPITGLRITFGTYMEALGTIIFEWMFRIGIYELIVRCPTAQLPIDTLALINNVLSKLMTNYGYTNLVWF